MDEELKKKAIMICDTMNVEEYVGLSYQDGIAKLLEDSELRRLQGIQDRKAASFIPDREYLNHRYKG
jgi:hypothetical protein